MTQIDPRFAQMREVLLQTVFEKYFALIEVINKTPIQQELKLDAIRFINAGYLFAKEGVLTVVFNFDAPVNEPIAVGEHNPEEAPEAHEAHKDQVPA